MKCLLFILLAVSGLARGESCPKRLVHYHHWHRQMDSAHFAFVSSLPTRDPASARKAGLTAVERRGIVAAYDAAVEHNIAWNDGNAILESMTEYYQRYYALGEDRAEKLNTIAIETQALVRSSVADTAQHDAVLFYVFTGRNPEGAKVGLATCTKGKELKKLMEKIRVARTELLVLQKERLRLLPLLHNLMDELGAPKDYGTREMVVNEQYKVAYSILMWEGLSPIESTFKNGAFDYPAIEWHDDGRTSLGALPGQMRKYETERNYRVVYSPGLNAGAGGSAVITSQQSPKHREILSVSARAIYEVGVDSSTRHEIRHAEIFRLLSTRTHSDITFLYATTQNAPQPIPKPEGAGKFYTHADELYTLAENVMSHSRDAVEKWRAGKKEDAIAALVQTSSFARIGKDTGTILLTLENDSRETVAQVKQEFTLEKGLAMVDDLTITDVNEASVVIYQVGPNDDYKLGFGVYYNLKGDPYVKAFVTNKGILGEFNLMDPDLIEAAREYVAKGKDHPELTKGYSALSKALETNLEKSRRAVQQYQRLYAMIYAKSYLPSWEALDEGFLEGLAKECARFAPFTPTFTPEIKP